MQQIRCFYCNTTLWKFQAHEVEVTEHTIEGEKITEAMETCYWCALKADAE